jgi:hypothetical protein
MLLNPGARRLTHAIKQPTVASVLNGTNFAAQSGRPLNTLVTLNFWQSACPEHEESNAFARLRDLRFTPFMGRPQKRLGMEAVQPTYVWSLENPSGVHGHWLVHIPEERRALFSQKLPGWFAEVTGGNVAEGALHIEEVYNPVGLVKYMLKGMDEVWAKTYKIAPEEQGPVVGKRAGTSRNIGKTARARAVERGEIAPLRRIFQPRPKLLGALDNSHQNEAARA